MRPSGFCIFGTGCRAGSDRLQSASLARCADPKAVSYLTNAANALCGRYGQLDLVARGHRAAQQNRAIFRGDDDIGRIQVFDLDERTPNAFGLDGALAVTGALAVASLASFCAQALAVPRASSEQIVVVMRLALFISSLPFLRLMTRCAAGLLIRKRGGYSTELRDVARTSSIQAAQRLGAARSRRLTIAAE
jgi:hypothetical protein